MKRDRRIVHLWERRNHDPAAAVELHRIEAEYLRAGEPPPPLLALWRAEANEAMLDVEEPEDGTPIEHHRVRCLARASGLAKANNRPSKFVSRRRLACAMMQAGADYDEAEFRKAVQAHYGVSPNTARAHVRGTKRAIDEARRLFPASWLRIEPRATGSTE